MQEKLRTQGFGLDRSETWQYKIDDISNPDKWEIGFEIVFRLAFYFHDPNPGKDALRDIEAFRDVFRHVFDLSRAHYDLAVGGPVSNLIGPAYWYVYWDGGPLDLRLLARCEAELDAVAIMKHVTVALVSMTIIPRSLRHIESEVKLKRKG